MTGRFERVDDRDGSPPVKIQTGRASRFRHVQAPHWVLLMKDLPHAAFRLYCILLAHANHERGDGKAWPTEQTLAEMMGYSRRQSITPLVKVLVELGLLDVEEVRYGSNRSRRRNVYTVHEEPAAGWEGIANLQEFYAARKAAASAAADVDQTPAPEGSGPAGAEADAGGAAPRPAPAAASAGKRGRGTGEGGRRPRASGTRRPAAGRRMTKEQGAALRAVEAAWPAPVKEQLPKHRPRVLRDTILLALDGRTPEQLVERIRRRWIWHNWDLKHEDGEIKSYVAVAVALVRPPTDCPDAGCEDGVMIDTGQPCRTCQTRREERRRDHRRGALPKPRGGAPALERPECASPTCSTVWGGEGEPPEGWMCRQCREQAERDEREAAEAAARLRERLAAENAALEETRTVKEQTQALKAAEEARIRGVLQARGLYGERLDWAVRQYIGLWHPGASLDLDAVLASTVP